MLRSQRAWHPLRTSSSPMSTMANPPTAVRTTQSSRNNLPSVHWLFRTNIPRRRNSYLPSDIHRRNMFGMTEVLSVLSNPAETVRSLTESRRLLDEARREIAEHKERSQIRPKHTFARFPGFFPRKAEMQAVERALEGEPSFTILFGASSTGKTALLREVLSRDQYHVLHFDLRIPGFADLASLYMSLSQQMQFYFEEIARKIDGYEEFQKEAWSFKHDRIDVERRIAQASSDAKCRPVKTSDIARLMELFQSSLLKYWEFRPSEDGSEVPSSPRHQHSDDTDRTRVDPGSPPRSKSRWTFPRGWRPSIRRSRTSQQDKEASNSEKGKEKPAPKKMPVIFFDEAHKLPGLIHSTEAMKCLLDSMLVLTKQDRLCHVIHSTSDPFYQTWLRQFNVMQHCKTITIGDCTKSETRSYFRDHILPRVPERLRSTLRFEVLYDAFGGKLAHWHDYVTDYVNSGGRLDIKQSSHFLQAHALLNLHIIHSSQSSSGAQEAANTAQEANTSNPETLHPGLGPAGFKIYSPITSRLSSTGFVGGAEENDRQNTLVAGVYSAEFTAMQLLKVMSRLTQPGTEYIPYFLLCRELGVRAVDGMVKGRLLDLRWTELVTREGQQEGTSVRVRSGVSLAPPPLAGMGAPLSPESGSAVGPPYGARSSGTAVDEIDEVMVPISGSEHEFGVGAPPPRDIYEEVMEIVGPKLVPLTPIMKYAMREVVQEYEDDGSASEYASLSDVDEY